MGGSIGSQTEGDFSPIQQKVEAQDKILNEMKENIVMLNEMITSIYVTILLMDALISHLILGRYPFPKDSPNYIVDDFEDEE